MSLLLRRYLFDSDDINLKLQTEHLDNSWVDPSA